MTGMRRAWALLAFGIRQGLTETNLSRAIFASSAVSMGCRRQLYTVLHLASVSNKVNDWRYICRVLSKSVKTVFVSLDFSL